MKKGEKGVFIALAFFGVLFLMPLPGAGADLTVSDVITGNGNMTLNGAMGATSFSGSGSGLTSLNPTNLSSGTANINISGNAATVINGLYSSGSYADPSWITSLSPAKLTSGTAGINISGNAATATTATTASNVTNGVYTTGSYADPSWITSLSPGKLTSGTANINISGNAATATTATTANSVADRAVTPVKIAFYGNVAVVAGRGGDYDNPATAMGDYDAWCRTPSATNPCLLKIMPGVYDIGTSTVVMQPYIDIEGSGQNVTLITGTVEGSYPTDHGVVNGADNAEIRFLTVKNTGGVIYNAAVVNSSASPAMTNITATASGGTGNFGVYNYSSSPTMTNVTATGSGGTDSYNYGVYNDNSPSPTMTNVTATASGGTDSYGVLNTSSSPTMSNVTATASGGGGNNYGVHNTGSSPTMSNVTATASGGTTSCGVLNTGSSSPTMTHVTAAGKDGDLNYGVYNAASSPTMSNVTATASGGTDSNYGVHNTGSSSPTMSNVTATASGGTGINYGVLNTASSPTMTNVTATASGGLGSFGVYNTGSSCNPTMSNVTATGKDGANNYGLFVNNGTPLIDRSTFEGSTYSIYNETGNTLYIGASKLVSAAKGGSGTYNCVLVYKYITSTLSAADGSCN